MGWLWLIIAIIVLATSLYALGRWDTNEDKLALFWAIFFASIFWPIILAVVVVFGPFAGLFWLGEYQREKKAKKNSGK